MHPDFQYVVLLEASYSMNYCFLSCILHICTQILKEIIAVPSNDRYFLEMQAATPQVCLRSAGKELARIYVSVLTFEAQATFSLLEFHH